MTSLQILGFVFGLISCAYCQHQNSQQNQDDYYHNINTPPPPQILTHKQALNHDGNFKYIFTSENGLAQGESIAPDGSRNGGYSYIDPNGKKITVKYTAGKEGFRILEADHLPKAPQPIAPLPQPQTQQHVYQPYINNNVRQEDDGQYRPQLYERPQAAQQAIQLPSRTYPRPSYQSSPSASPSTVSNAIEQEEKDYYDEPGKPHSFGSGYVFEFGG